MIIKWLWTLHQVRFRLSPGRPWSKISCQVPEMNSKVSSRKNVWNWNRKGKNYSFYFDETAAGLGIQFQVGSLLNMSEFGSEIIFIEPAPPLLQLECDNCVNGPLVANFGSNSPYENITCKLLSSLPSNQNLSKTIL